MLEFFIIITGFGWIFVIILSTIIIYSFILNNRNKELIPYIIICSILFGWFFIYVFTFIFIYIKLKKY